MGCDIKRRRIGYLVGSIMNGVRWGTFYATLGVGQENSIMVLRF